ncbi:MAG: M14 family metallopeptidase, partial [Bacillota bacterium]
MTFDTVSYFNGDYSLPDDNGGVYLDVCGYFDLIATSGGEEIASTMMKISPYDQFSTMNDIYNQLDEMVDEAKPLNNFYLEKFSMGTSSAGYDMPYLILSDAKSSVDNWKEYVDFAITTPTAALEAIANGKYNDIRIPIMMSNVHPDETSAVDGMMSFTWKIIEAVKNGTPTLTYKILTGFTPEGEAQLQLDIEKNNIAMPELVEDYATRLGYIYADNFNPETGIHYSGVVDLEKYYTTETVSVNIADLLSNVFFIITPEQNVDGRTYLTRTSAMGLDLNRDNSAQILSETQNIQHLIGQYNPLVLTEMHGRVNNFQCEPCDPPHEPNFEYDLLAKYAMLSGEAFGIAAIANNDDYNSFVIAQRDYLQYLDDGSTYWAEPWDDMYTSYTPQFAMLHGTIGYTMELPAYSDSTADATLYGLLGQANYLASEKIGLLTNQAKIWERGATNANSNAYELVGQWHSDQYDAEGAEADMFRPIYDGEGENQNFYPECYIIPMDSENQNNLANAYEMMEWFARNDVKIKLTEKEITIDGTTYPK